METWPRSEGVARVPRKRRSTSPASLAVGILKIQLRRRLNAYIEAHMVRWSIGGNDGLNLAGHREHLEQRRSAYRQDAQPHSSFQLVRSAVNGATRSISVAVCGALNPPIPVAARPSSRLHERPTAASYPGPSPRSPPVAPRPGIGLAGHRLRPPMPLERAQHGRQRRIERVPPARRR